MDKLEVGMYVRTIHGDIAKIIKTTEVTAKTADYEKHIEYYLDKPIKELIFDEYRFTNYLFIFDNGFEEQQNEDDNQLIKKASHNIIDLIEVGDFVNGTKIHAVTISKNHGKHLHIYSKYIMTGGVDLLEEDIKEIVTKEQYKGNAYKLEVE